MGAILLIEDDRKLHRLIEKLFSQEDLKGALKALRASPRDQEGGSEGPSGPWLKEVAPLGLDEAVREYVKEEISLGSYGSIHEFVIGKVERTLIGLILEEEKGNQFRTAKRLGINRNTLRKKMKDLQIVPRVVTR
jgi:two-component system nitrogen regulation response regulator GlnG